MFSHLSNLTTEKLQLSPLCDPEIWAAKYKHWKTLKYIFKTNVVTQTLQMYNKLYIFKVNNLGHLSGSVG